MQSRNHKIVNLLAGLTTGEGIRPSVLDGVKTLCVFRDSPRCPVFYEPSIVIVASGSKKGFVGSRTFTYDPENYLILAVPLPFECETSVADDGSPMRGVSIRVDPVVVAELVLKAELPPRPAIRPSEDALAAVPLKPSLSDALLRLLEAMSHPSDCRILGPQIVREVVYRVLCDERGDVLRGLLSLNGNASQIYRALHRIHESYAESLDVPELAEAASMSLSAFHQSFKAVTATSPLRYIKVMRLHRARMLMVQDGLGAALAAARVGYASASQFSREFKRLFGVSPAEEMARFRAALGAGMDDISQLEMI